MADEERLKEFKEANKIVFDPNTRQVWENQNRDGTKPATTFQSEEDIKRAAPESEKDTSATSGIVPTLQNIVATVTLGCRLDLKTVALHARNAEYNPKRFAAVIMRIREPKTTALIFASGKMVVTGAKVRMTQSWPVENMQELSKKSGLLLNSQTSKYKILSVRVTLNSLYV